MVNSPYYFRFVDTPKIIFGPGSLNELSRIAGILGPRILLITGNNSYSKTSIRNKIENLLNVPGIRYNRFIVTGEPSPETIDRAVREYKNWEPCVIIAAGGGSVMDAGKAIAAMLCENEEIVNYLEDVGSIQPSGNKVPLVAIPTTAGTGSEATKNAVISRTGKGGFKKSLRHDNYVPEYAIIDPELSLECPQELTAASGMDAFTQLLESYLSTQSSPITDALALSGLASIARSLEIAFINGSDISARTDMAYAALISGITLANAGLGVVHGFAQPLGSIFPVPHGVVCGTLMGIANRVTVEKLQSAGSDTIVFRKYASVGELFIKNPAMDELDKINFLLDTIDRYIEKFNIPRLSEYGIHEEDMEEIVRFTGLKNHPVHLDGKELISILKSRL